MNEEIKMNRNSVHLDYPLTHPGVERAEQVVANFKRLSDSFSPTHTMAAMLLAAIAFLGGPIFTTSTLTQFPGYKTPNHI